MSAKQKQESSSKEKNHTYESPKSKNKLKIINLKFAKLINTILFDLPPNIKITKVNTLIGIIRSLTIPLYILLMCYYKNVSTGAYTTLALHGGYSIASLARVLVFPKRSWEQQIGLGSLPIAACYFALYWYFGYLTISGEGLQYPSGERLFVCSALLIIGTMIAFCAELQKHFVLRYKEGLITNGFFKLMRNPNYLGEIMVSLSFASLVGLEITWYVIVAVWILVFWPRIWEKDLKLESKKGWDEYSRNSYKLLPKLFQNDLINYIIYTIILFIVYVLFESEGLTGIVAGIHD